MLAGNTAREIRLEWQVFEPDPGPSGNGLSPPTETRRTLGVDLRTELARRAKKVLFNPSAMSTERTAARGSRRTPRVNLADTSTMPDVFAFKTVNTTSGQFGYIRIWTFMADETPFVNEFVRIASLLPKNGLIIDVRGNGGGNILCAELLLQLLTPHMIEPLLLSFLSSSLTLDICKQNDFVSTWLPSISQSVETGEIYSQGFSILPVDEYNSLGQRYQGPVVLIVDPLCYSATDIFSAGFQDNAIGPILSAGGRTGAGGANVWDHDLLRQVLPTGPFTALPKGASFRVAIRRIVRSGKNRGGPLEDLGVTPNVLHQMTNNDLLHTNVDLINRAGQMLAALPKVTLDVSQIGTVVAGKRTLRATTHSLDRVDVHVDGRPRASVDVSDGTTQIEVPNAGTGVQDIAVHGFKNGTLEVVVHFTP